MTKTTTSSVPEPNNHSGVCPFCGYCPTCGRKNAAPVYPWPYQPVWVYPYWYTHATYPNYGTMTLTCQTTAGSAPQFTLTGGTYTV